MLPPESASAEDVGREIGVGADTLERWRSEALSRPARERAWTAAARFDAVLTTAAMDEAAKSAWCRANGVDAQGPAAWGPRAPPGPGEPQGGGAQPRQAKQDPPPHQEPQRE